MTNGFMQRFKGRIAIGRGSTMQMGASGAAMQIGGGNLFTAAFAAAGQNPGAINADNVLAVFNIPAGVFDAPGRLLTVTAQGAFANNTNTKTTKIIINPASAVVGSTVGTGGTTIATAGPYSTTGACGWALSAQIAKYGLAGSNTQVAQMLATIINTTHGGMGAPVALTLNESSSFLIAITGDAVTTATDIGLTWAEVTGNN